MELVQGLTSVNTEAGFLRRGTDRIYIILNK